MHVYPADGMSETLVRPHEDDQKMGFHYLRPHFIYSWNSAKYAI